MSLGKTDLLAPELDLAAARLARIYREAYGTSGQQDAADALRWLVDVLKNHGWSVTQSRGSLSRTAVDAVVSRYKEVVGERPGNSGAAHTLAQLEDPIGREELQQAHEDTKLYAVLPALSQVTEGTQGPVRFVSISDAVRSKDEHVPVVSEVDHITFERHTHIAALRRDLLPIAINIMELPSIRQGRQKLHCIIPCSLQVGAAAEGNELLEQSCVLFGAIEHRGETAKGGHYRFVAAVLRKGGNRQVAVFDDQHGRSGKCTDDPNHYLLTGEYKSPQEANTTRQLGMEWTPYVAIYVPTGTEADLRDHLTEEEVREVRVGVNTGTDCFMVSVVLAALGSRQCALSEVAQNLVAGVVRNLGASLEDLRKALLSNQSQLVREWTLAKSPILLHLPKLLQCEEGLILHIAKQGIDLIRAIYEQPPPFIANPCLISQIQLGVRLSTMPYPLNCLKRLYSCSCALEPHHIL